MGKGNFYKEIPWEGVNLKFQGGTDMRKGFLNRGGGVQIIIGIAHHNMYFCSEEQSRVINLTDHFKA